MLFAEVLNGSYNFNKGVEKSSFNIWFVFLVFKVVGVI